jgi:glycosyltransferase involved in cell wall biosynthesis
VSTLRLLGLSTSFPLRPDGCAGVFVQRLYQNLPDHWRVEVVCPDDDCLVLTQSHPGHHEGDRLRIHPVRYAPRAWQVLAQQSGGVMSGLRSAPWRTLLLPLLLLGMAWRCLRLARHADLIHANWAICGVIASLAGRLTRRPVVTTLRGDDVSGETRSWIKRKLLDAAVNGSHSIVCVSEAMATQLRARYARRARDIHVCLNGIDETFLKVTHTPDMAGKLRVVAIGSLIPRKGYDVLIDAVARMRHRDQIQVRIAGGGPERLRLLQRAIDLGVADRFDLVGELAPECIPQFLVDADAFVLSSRSEGRPNVVIEALAAGLPVVCSVLPGVEGLVEPGENGWLVDVGDIAGFAQALDQVCADPQERARRGAIARERMLRSPWGWSMAGSCYDQVFRSALKLQREGIR